MKRIFYHGLLAGILASVAAVVYFYLYKEFFLVDFDAIVNIGSIVGSSILGCLLMALGYMLLRRFNKENLTGALNILIAVLSFLSIISVMSMSLPLEIEFPELFPGLVIPMHFFPALAFTSLYPFFNKPKY
ncbi:MAG: hypothetical protein NWQ46_11260 [Spirosomaceae bacterium]|jgi:asparagine N-glycosylation enzyme membrane subunit Stt3|nr:hypothetical protein [Spirosomataceae bacterium]MDP5139093.1 hypothetical protein [Spirosomataceae bacterium]